MCFTLRIYLSLSSTRVYIYIYIYSFFFSIHMCIYLAYILIFIYYRRHIFFSNLNYLVCNIPTSSSIHMHTLSLSTLRHIHVLKILDTVIFFLNMYSMYARYRYGTVHMVYTVHNMCICMVYKSYIYIFFFSDITAPTPDFIKYAIANRICDMSFFF